MVKRNLLQEGKMGLFDLLSNYGKIKKLLAASNLII